MPSLGAYVSSSLFALLSVGKQVLEIMAFCLITVSCWFAIPYIYGCRAKHSLCDVEVSALPTRCRQAHCAEGYYSEAATIVYSTSNEIAALLFDRSLEWSEEFHAAPLITYGLIYFVLVATIYGAYVPGGLFVPSIVVGGVYGRVIGIACEAMFLSSGINPGIYSLLGAASMLGGFTRLALPVVIMLVELTGDATYLLPMMLCSAIGKFLSDYIEPPLYPQHMALEKIPSLTDKLNPAIAKLTAKQIMLPAEKCFTSADTKAPTVQHARTHPTRSSFCSCLTVRFSSFLFLCLSMSTIERLSHVKNVLEKSKRVVFPLITPAGTFAGLILTRSETNTAAAAHTQSEGTTNLTSSFSTPCHCSQQRDVLSDGCPDVLYLPGGSGAGRSRPRRGSPRRFAQEQARLAQRQARLLLHDHALVGRVRGPLDQLHSLHGRRMPHRAHTDAGEETRGTVQTSRTQPSLHHRQGQRLSRPHHETIAHHATGRTCGDARTRTWPWPCVGGARTRADAWILVVLGDGLAQGLARTECAVDRRVGGGAEERRGVALKTPDQMTPITPPATSSHFYTHPLTAFASYDPFFLPRASRLLVAIMSPSPSPLAES